MKTQDLTGMHFKSSMNFTIYLATPHLKSGLSKKLLITSMSAIRRSYMIFKPSCIFIMFREFSASTATRYLSITPAHLGCMRLRQPAQELRSEERRVGKE